MDVGLAAAMGKLIAYKYWLLLPLAIVEGPMIAFVSGMLVALGYFNPAVALFILVVGDLIPDGLFFTLGHFVNRYEWVRRIAHRIGLNDERREYATKLWRTHPGKAILVSKFAFGISTVLLFTAGVAAVPARKFFSYSVTISILNYGTLLTLGYFFGASLALVNNVLTMIQIAAAAVLVLGIIYHLVMRYIRSRIAID